MNNAKKLLLYRGFPVSNFYASSPYVIKLEFRLRLAGVSYKLGAGSPRSAPKGKIPYVDLAPLSEDGTGPEMMGDSTLIVRELEERGMVSKLWDAEDEVVVLGLRSLLEERLYFYSSKEKWLDNYATQRDTALHAIPFPMRYFVGWMIWRNMHNALYMQGTLRFSNAELKTFKEEIWRSFAAKLRKRKGVVGEKKEAWWLLGSQPTEADVDLYGFVVSVITGKGNPETKAIVNELPILEEWAIGLHERWFPDYEMWILLEKQLNGE